MMPEEKNNVVLDSKTEDMTEQLFKKYVKSQEC